MFGSLGMPQELGFNELLIHADRIKARDDLVLVVKELNCFSKFLLENAHPTCMDNGWCNHVIRGHWREPELESFLVNLVD